MEEDVKIPVPDGTDETLVKKLDQLLDAVKELTKVTGDLAKEWEKWRKAGKF